MSNLRLFSIGLLGLGGLVFALTSSAAVPEWSLEEQSVIASLSLSELGPLPPDPSNRVADDRRAVELGRAIFFDAV